MAWFTVFIRYYRLLVFIEKKQNLPNIYDNHGLRIPGNYASSLTTLEFVVVCFLTNVASFQDCASWSAVY